MLCSYQKEKLLQLGRSIRERLGYALQSIPDIEQH